MLTLLKCATSKLLVVIFTQSKSFMLASTNAANTLWELAAPANWRPVIASSFANCFSAFVAWYRHKLSMIMSFAKLFALGGFTTNSALQLRPPALLAQKQSIFSIILTWGTWPTTFLTFNRFPNSLPSLGPVMLKAQSQTKMWSIAYFAEAWWAMYQRMLTVILAKLKILKSVIVSNFIDMVNLFNAGEVSSDSLFHHKSMFQYKSTLVAGRVIRALNVNISLWGWSFGSGGQVVHSMFQG